MPNGKLDRKKLPAPQRATREYVAPQGDTEILIAEIVSELLGVERIGRDESFFELGGNSIGAARLVARIESRLNQTITLRNIFERPSVRGLAELIDLAAEEDERLGESEEQELRAAVMGLSDEEVQQMLIAEGKN